jgi:hypothetical protein
MFFNQCEATSITTRQQFVLAAMAVAPDRADGVDHPLGRKLVAAGDFGLADGAAAERAASTSNSGPAPRWIAPSTPPPSNVVLAAFTMASTRCPVMSPAMMASRSGLAGMVEF